MKRHNLLKCCSSKGCRNLGKSKGGIKANKKGAQRRSLCAKHYKVHKKLILKVLENPEILILSEKGQRVIDEKVREAKRIRFH